MDTAANQSNNKTTRPGTSWLHLRVYEVLVGLAVWFAVAVWSFVGAGVTDYLLFIASGFIFVAVTLQVILSCVGCSDNSANGTATNSEDKPSLIGFLRSTPAAIPAQLGSPNPSCAAKIAAA